jgi:hypothetical protein
MQSRWLSCGGFPEEAHELVRVALGQGLGHHDQEVF